MPDPNAHAEDMLSPAKHDNALPPLWWLFPWPHAKRLLAKLDAADSAAEKRAYDMEQRWLEANEALIKAQGDLDEEQSQHRAASARAEGFRKAHETEITRSVYWELQTKDARLKLAERLNECRSETGRKPRGKLLFDDKVGGNSIYAPKAKPKKKGGRK